MPGPLKKYLRKLDGSLHDTNFVAVEFLLMWVVFALLALVALGLEGLVYRIVMR
jgi:hypothetical protein